MNDLAFGVEVVQPKKNLFSDLLNDVRGDTSVLISFDEPQKVLAQDLERKQISM